MMRLVSDDGNLQDEIFALAAKVDAVRLAFKRKFGHDPDYVLIGSRQLPDDIDCDSIQSTLGIDVAYVPHSDVILPVRAEMNPLAAEIPKNYPEIQFLNRFRKRDSFSRIFLVG